MKRAIFFSAALIFALSVTVMADPGDTLWTRTYGDGGDDRANVVFQNSDGDYLIGGKGVNNLIKTNALGDIIWDKHYGKTIFDVQQTLEGGYVLAGGWGACLIKIDSSGDVTWIQDYGGGYDLLYSVQQTPDRGYIAAGIHWNSPHYDWYIVKTDSLGNIIWDQQYGTNAGDEYAQSVLQTADGNLVVTGFTTSYGSGAADIWLMKLDTNNGSIIWSRTYGGDGIDKGVKVRIVEDGAYVVGGWTTSFGAGNHDFYLIKTDSLGNLTWERTFGGNFNDQVYNMTGTIDGGLILVGWTDSFGAGGDDLYLVKTDIEGYEEWSYAYGGSNDDIGNSIKQTDDSNYIVAGYTNSFGAGGYDFYLIKVEGDNAYPSITNTIANPQYPKPEEPCEVSATITDQDGIIPSADLYYDTGSGYTPLAMSNVADSFFATIPGQPESTLVNYYISATDNQGAVTVSDTMAYFVVDKVARIYMAPMDPPIEIPPGGYFQFVGILQNKTPLPQAIDVWIMLDVPGIGQYGPIMRFNNLSLAPDQIISSPGVRQDIPIFAPLGVYDYIAYCGIYEDIFPELIIDSASFQFTVVPGQISDGANGWNLSGWFDENIPIEVPAEFSLSNNYPNPFNAATTISYQLPQSCNVNLDIYNLAGQKVATLENGYKEAGEYSVSWNAANYASGIYFYRLTAGDNIITRRMTLLK